MHAILKVNEKQAAWLAEELADELLGEMELQRQGPEDETNAFLELADRITTNAALIRGIREDRETVEVERIKDLAYKQMRESEASIGYETACLARITAGEPGFVVKGTPTESETNEGEATARAAIARLTKEALLARGIFEAARDIERESVTV